MALAINIEDLLNKQKIDGFLQEMVGYNNKLNHKRLLI